MSAVVRRHSVVVEPLSEAEIGAWRAVPPAVASDAMGRRGSMAAAIKPLDTGMRLFGQARTVECMASDNSALHAAIGLGAPGQVLVTDARGFEDAALFGGLMCRAAMAQGLAGLVIDGAVRDAAEIIAFGFAVFSRAVAPRGPHKAFGGVLDGPIACGGVAVSPGDLVIGDADGVVVVPFDQRKAVLTAAQAVLAKEQEAEALVAAGGSLSDLYGRPTIEPF